MQRIILHIDFDSFFASVEQQYNPALRGKPIGVTAANSRTCIIAASREAKQFGVKTGSVSYKAYEKCPQLILVPADFIKYFEISKKFLSIAKDYSPFVELFSIDEVFMDVTLTAHLFGSVDRLIARIKQRILEEIGEYITVSVGVSHNKLLAKLASGLKKPNGVCYINEHNIEGIYKTAQLTDICGIGERIRLRLNAIGIYTLLQLKTAHLEILIQEFGKHQGRVLKNIGLGKDDSEIIPYTQKPEVKSVGRNYCLPKNEYNQRVVLQNIYELCEEIAIKLRRLGKKARTVGIALRGDSDIHGEETYGFYFDTGSEIFTSLMCDFISRSYQHYVRQISVWVKNLEDASHITLPLFSEAKKNESLWKAVDYINQRFGNHTVRNGFLLYADKLTTVPNSYLADKFERTKLAKEARSSASDSICFLFSAERLSR